MGLSISKQLKLRWPRWWQWGPVLVVLLLLLSALLYLAAESLWFEQVNYLEMFRRRLLTQLGLGISAAVLSLSFALGNLTLAFGSKPPPPPSQAAVRSGGRGLGWLLPLTVGLGLLVGAQLLYQGQVVASYWQETSSLYNATPPLPLWTRPGAVGVLVARLVAQPWQLIALALSAIALIVYPRSMTRLAAGLMSLGFGLIWAGHWSRVLLAFNPTPFGQSDPIFERDIEFYIFSLPVLEMINFWLLGLVFFLLVTVSLVYLLAGNNLSQGRFYGFSQGQKRHLYALAGGLFLATSLSHWLARYERLYSQDSVIYGAGYTDVHINLPANTLLCLLSLLLSIGFIWRSALWPLIRVRLMGLRPSAARPLQADPIKGSSGSETVGRYRRARATDAPQPQATPHVRSRLLSWGIAVYLLVLGVGTLALPLLVQRLVVQPNELAREQPYILNSISLTRSAFELSDINVESFDPVGDLSAASLQENSLTLDNIRLWDTRPLLETNRQLQQIRLYYEFFDADVDRYSILNEEGTYDRRQVLVSARELNYERVPDIAKTWVNEHLVYTHGYGFTMSPVNTAAPDGLPDYFIRGIENVPSSPEIGASIPTGEPRIYFGELTNTYILSNTRVPELDYPSGEENVYTAYQGRAGIDVGNFWRRLIFAGRLLDWRMLFTEDITPQTRLLFRRNIRDRIQAIAPFLRFDTDPYLVAVNIGDDSRRWGTDPAALAGNNAAAPPASQVPLDTGSGTFAPQESENFLYWIIDAYTLSDRYPYSDPGSNDFNYIRNSVKVVVDAYNGSVGFFVADPNDPIIASWSRVFPGMFRPLSAMPQGLLQHIRYPQDLFQVQSDQLMAYHMTDAQVFYNREDQWRAPNEIYANEAQQVEPYYLIMKLPEEETEEFILLRLFTPSQRNNLVAWLAARSDGERYGLRLLYRFPKQELVFGPEQIEARINQDPAISQRISLWNTQGSRAQQGNLLVIPVEQSLLYVEPLYLVAEQNRLPALTRVIVAFQNRIAMAETLQQALAAIFLQERPTEPPILRELEESLPPDGETPLPPAAPDLPGESTGPEA
ncbi:MAG TPA: UPF0182 family protein [Trichocoleus sp.]